MSKYKNIIGLPAYRTKKSVNDYKVGIIERSRFPLLPPLILRFNNGKGIRAYPKDLIIVDNNGKDKKRANNMY